MIKCFMYSSTSLTYYNIEFESPNKEYTNKQGFAKSFEDEIFMQNTLW